MKHRKKLYIYPDYSLSTKKINTLELLAEKEVSISKTNNLSNITPPITELLEPIVSVNFARAVFFKNKIVIQGEINKNMIYKADNNIINYEEEGIEFSKEINLPGLSPYYYTGKFNRLIKSNPVIEINNLSGFSNGIDIQLYLNNLSVKQFLVNNTTVEQKIIVDFIIKVSRLTQNKIKLPKPAPVFTCHQKIPCNNKVIEKDKKKKKKKKRKRRCIFPFEIEEENLTRNT
ncbi:DUF3794 domain-containing protein [Halocella sp. SP3-1]|uniref:DUF3794 domain-containing protein n=1 Tax=Halocella sp. SP3-1 TaxID=2382161 RepID=UPI000F755D2B|nr:DUF3794 domain-containing protein [Halocella sp. SP3-1]AZO95570.1 DUF3794 domain-containing protein [Halocella sp. SP3-1]